MLRLANETRRLCGVPRVAVEIAPEEKEEVRVEEPVFDLFGVQYDAEPSKVEPESLTVAALEPQEPKRIVTVDEWRSTFGLVK